MEDKESKVGSLQTENDQNIAENQQQTTQNINNNQNEAEEEPVRELTQTDHLNKRLLSAFLDKINQATGENSDQIGEDDWDDQDNDDQPGTVSIMAGRVLVVGISGTTNSGKSTLARRLEKCVEKAIWVCQDTYYIDPPDPRLEPLYIPELKHHNWEDFRALEMDKMVNEVQTLMVECDKTKGENNVHIFVEGFSIFGWRPLVELLDKKYFLSVDKGVCWDRRKHRDYDPPDVPGFFEKIVWPAHLQHREHIQDQHDIVYMDCNKGIEDIFNRICSDLDLTTKSDEEIS